MNSKQQQTRRSVIKNQEEIEHRGAEDHIKTLITHNKGGKWDLIKAPTEDVNGEPIKCYLEDDCSLHLQIYSSNGLFPPPYSQDSAIGIIMAVGNLGRGLEKQKVDRMNTYLSRDGGLNWSEVRKGSYIYEIGDHGGLIVMADNTKQTTDVIYTFNEGKTWHELTISDTPMDVTNIIIEPLSISQ
jgi:Sortilin, neurotensin receptor 3,